MPELPDVETFRRHLDRHALRQEIASVEVEPTRMLKGVTPAALRRRLTGRAFAGTRRHGKFLLVALADDGWLVLHFGMTGYLDYAKDGGPPPDHTRLVVHFANGARLAGSWLRLLGRIALADDADAFVAAEKLGPDALDLSRGTLGDMLAGRKGAIKPALMDQSFIAGLGNVYSDEALFQARLHPRKRAAALTGEEVAALHAALRRVLETAIAREADPERLPESWLLPHREDGAKCPRCGGRIARVSISGRHAFLCPACQKA